MASSGTFSPLTPSFSRLCLMTRSASRIPSVARPSEGFKSEATLNIR